MFLQIDFFFCLVCHVISKDIQFLYTVPYMENDINIGLGKEITLEGCDTVNWVYTTDTRIIE